MKRTTCRVLVLVLVLAIAGAACGNADDDHAGSIAAEGLEAELAGAICKGLEHCYWDYALGSGLAVLTAGGGLAGCRAMMQDRRVNLQPLVAAITSGRVVYDGEKARACLERFHSVCREPAFSEAFAECFEAFQGMVTAGNVCAVDQECAGDAYCTRTPDVCGGLCQPKKAAGEACTRDAECRPADTGEAACARNADNVRICVAARWTYDIPEGQPCGDLTPDAAGLTLLHRQCAVGLYCPSRPGAPGTCTKPVPLGHSCEDDGPPCAGAAICQPDPLRGFNRTCQKVSVRNRPGESCDDALLQCNSLQGLRCVSGSCDAIGDGTEGASCEGYARCDEGLYCERVRASPAECARKKANGTMCSYDEECVSGRCLLEGTDGSCVDPCAALL